MVKMLRTDRYSTLSFTSGSLEQSTPSRCRRIFRNTSAPLPRGTNAPYRVRRSFVARDSWFRGVMCYYLIMIWFTSMDCWSVWVARDSLVASAAAVPPQSFSSNTDETIPSISSSASTLTDAASSSSSLPNSGTQRDGMKLSYTSLPPSLSVTQPTLPIPKDRILTLKQVVYRAGQRGLGGGIPGAIAGAIQVLSLMWLRTIINYQCRYGTTFAQAMRTLLNDGGIARLYCGVGFALIQAPLSRFVSTAANDGIESLLANLSWTRTWGPGRTTVVASIVVGLWRMLLMPVDTAKTVLQIDSVEGFRSLMRRVKGGKIGLLYSGAIANTLSAILAHYPWFYTYNILSTSDWMQVVFPSPLLRRACIGVTASVVSDTIVNVFRVIKTTKQSLGSKQSANYSETVKIILAADGWRGLFGRGLRTRIYANALQSIVFTIVWRGLADYWKHRVASTNEAKTG